MKINADDGFNPELFGDIPCEGTFELPKFTSPVEFRIPGEMIPFSHIDKATDPANTFVVFYEKDNSFAEFVKNPEHFVEKLKKFKGVVSPDISLCLDSPLAVIIANTYRNHALGCYLQRQGIYVIPNVRWADKRTYTSSNFSSRIAFDGIPKHSIVSIGSYGCLKEKEYRKHFAAGLEEMLKTLLPKVVLVYGNLPAQIFDKYKDQTTFIAYKDWLSNDFERHCHGNR